MENSEAERLMKHLRIPVDLIAEIQAKADEAEWSFNKTAVVLLRKGLSK
jgi:hypothetical protein